MLDHELVVVDGQTIDADVTVGRGAMKDRCRLVEIPTPKGYGFFLTNVPRTTHGPHQVGDLYRIRWEIGIDAKVDKAGARLDEITARKPVSARILVLATLLNTTRVPSPPAAIPTSATVREYRVATDEPYNGRALKRPLRRAVALMEVTACDLARSVR